MQLRTEAGAAAGASATALQVCAPPDLARLREWIAAHEAELQAAPGRSQPRQDNPRLDYLTLAVGLGGFGLLAWGALVPEVLFVGQLGTALLIAATAVFVLRQLDPHAAALASLRRWTAAYDLHFERLRGSSLPLLILDDALWQALLAGNVPSLVAAVVPPPRSIPDRLLFAAACWTVLERHGQGEHTGLALELAEAWPAIQRLRSGPASLSTSEHLTLLARFAALYDYFYGPLTEPPEPAST
jgi:hypothetical protein